MVNCVLYVAVPCSYAIPLLRTYEHRDFLYTQVKEFSYFVRYGEPDMYQRITVHHNISLRAKDRYVSFSEPFNLKVTASATHLLVCGL
jgi:hypothetical protein